MFPAEILLAYLVAVCIVVAAPGPDNLLAVSRGLSQGLPAAISSSAGAGGGILLHTLAATLGLVLLLQTSPLAFWAVKIAGAAYLLWLGYQAMVARRLVSFSRSERQPLQRVFLVGLLTNLLNPKVGLFVVAFIPQFVAVGRGSMPLQMLVYGAIYAGVTIIVFSLLGGFAAQLSAWIEKRPQAVAAVNIGAGFTFVCAGLSILALDQRR